MLSPIACARNSVLLAKIGHSMVATNIAEEGIAKAQKSRRATRS
jgi:hypothetical protein